MRQLLLIAKYIGAIATIAGAALWMDAKFDTNTEILEDVQQTIEYINVEQQFMAEDIRGIHDTLEEFEKQQGKQTESINSITWILKNQDNFTQDQLEDIMNEMMRKSAYTRGAGEVIFLPID